MERKFQKPRNKPFICFDENLEFYQMVKQCSKFATFQSFVNLMRKQGSKDLEVIKKCNQAKKHIITHNTKDFQNPSENILIGIICIGLKKEDSWIPKFERLLRHFPKHNDYFYKTILIGNFIQIKDRKTGDIKVLL